MSSCVISTLMKWLAVYIFFLVFLKKSDSLYIGVLSVLSVFSYIKGLQIFLCRSFVVVCRSSVVVWVYDGYLYPPYLFFYVWRESPTSINSVIARVYLKVRQKTDKRPTRYFFRNPVVARVYLKVRQDRQHI